MKRGDLVTIAASGPFTGKPRPAVVIQSDAFTLDSITVCLLTSEPIDTTLFRIPVEPNQKNGLERSSWIMADKIVTLRKQHIRQVVGRLSEEDMQRLNRAVVIFLGLVATTTSPAA